MENSKTNNSQNSSKYLIWFLLIVFVFLFGFSVGKVDFSKLGKQESSQEQKYVLEGEVKSKYKTVDVGLLWQVWNILETEYIEDNLEGQDLLYGAVKGLVEGLDDPYTSFLTPEESKQLESANRGEFEGIGTTLKQDGEYVAIESPIDNSPAYNSGLRPDDIILKVDNQDVDGQSVFEVAALIRGEAGTTVNITYYRPSTSETLDVEIIRQKIDTDNVTFKKLANGIGEIKIQKFTEDSAEAFNRQWDVIVEQALAANPKGLVIDLRYNPGGYVSSVEYVASEFLDKGDVIFMEEDKYGNRLTYEVKRKGKFTNIPIVVLVNDGSASAAEIFAGAIQDHDRGVIVGKKTVGKGLEQKVIKDFPDGSTLQIVFQRWLTPDGKNITEEDPIHPDIVIEDYQKQEDKALELLS